MKEVSSQKKHSNYADIYTCPSLNANIWNVIDM